jgi:hypothetical protein
MRNYLSETEIGWFNATDLAKQWCEVVLHLKANKVSHANMKKVVRFAMC